MQKQAPKIPPQIKKKKKNRTESWSSVD